MPAQRPTVDNRGAIDPASQSTNFVSPRPPASVISVANQISTFHASVLPMMSSQVTTCVTTIASTTITAAMAGSTTEPPAIHTPRAQTTSTRRVISRREIGPIACSCSLAHRGASGASVMPGG
jgi:hypothetical protein